MRIKAFVGEKLPIYEMANGASETIGYIEPNSFVTVTGLKKDGGNTYYITDEHSGYIKKSGVKIVRDEEFFYASSLLRKKQNRDANNRYSTMKKSIAAYVPSGAGISAGDFTVGGGWGGGLPAGSAGNNSSVIPPYTSGSIGVSASNASVKGASSQSTRVTRPSTDPANIRPGPANFQSAGSMLLGSLTGNLMSGGGFGGFLNDASNMNLGGMLGSAFGGTVGGLFNGATISNIMDGTFFNDIFSQNAISIISDVLGTLLQKLDYVVGFNISGAIISLVDGFAGYSLNGISKIRSAAREYTPPRLSIDGDKDARIRKYFSYKGSNYQMISRGPAGLLGGAEYGPIDFNTQTLGSTRENTDIVQSRRENYNTLYEEFYDNLNEVRDSVNLNITRNDWFYNFNRFRLIHPDSLLAHSKGYIFFTRPDLNLVSSSGATSDIGLFINSMSQAHPAILASLQKSPRLNGVAFDHGHKFIPLLGNRCTGIDINDEELETKEVNDTYTGWKLNYGTTTIRSKTANTVTTSFIDDEQLSIYLMIKLWAEYISNVSRGIIAPNPSYVRSLQLDYAISIYYFLCAQDGQSILFWTKFTGCIPKTIPSSNFSDQYDTPIKMPKYSITWQYAFKKDLDPYSLAEFNHLSNASSSGMEGMPLYDPHTIHSTKTIVGSPYIDTNTGGRLYRLLFKEAANKFTA